MSLHESIDPVLFDVGIGGDSAGDVDWPLIVVGAGAAGLTAAIFAGREGVPALLLESKARPGAKIRVSGGGRCNVLPQHAVVDDFHGSGSPNALRQLLSSWPLSEVRAFFESDLGLTLRDEHTGKVFPASDDARDVLFCLLREAARVGARILSGGAVDDIHIVGPPGAARRFAIRLQDGRSLCCARLILATGGRSLPKSGSDGHGLELARRLGIAVEPTYPALVPLATGDPGWSALAGISLRATLTAKRAGRVLEQRSNDFLFTHRGFSGPVVLDLSWRMTRPGAPAAELFAAWPAACGRTWESLLLDGGARSVATCLSQELPRRLAQELLRRSAVDPARRLAELTREERKRLLQQLDDCALNVQGDEGYAKAEVTAGGVALTEVSTKTLEARGVPGLSFAGEILDVTGRLGGYNFLWAWVSGRQAGRFAAQALRAPLAPPAAPPADGYAES